jgi:hypothetical protein
MTAPGTPTTETFTEKSHPAWRVAGPYGAVTYHSVDNHLHIEPRGAAGESAASLFADELKLLAATGTDADVFAALRNWYERLPDLAGRAASPDPAATLTPDPVDVPAPVRAEIERLRGLRGGELVDALDKSTWYVHPNDVIGGWSIMPVDAPPSSGCVEVADCIAEQIAHGIADRHNARLRIEQEHAERLRRHRVKVAARPDVRPGDLIDVPAGADGNDTARHRIQVDKVNHFGASGYRIKTDGTPMVSRSVSNARSDGYAWGGVQWDTLLKSTIYRDGQIIYQPEGNQ